MKRSKILIVDDDGKSQSLLSRYVEHMGYEPVIAVSGFEAIKIVRAQRPDLVLLDVMMPDMNGFDILSILKSDPNSFAIPVVMITALSDDQHRIRSKELGAEDFITKPFSFQEIRGRVNSIMQVRDLHNDLQFAQNVISKLTDYQENILLNFNLRTFDVDSMFNLMLKKVIWDSYGPSGPSTILIVFNDGAGWWKGKVYRIKESQAEAEAIAFPRVSGEDDLAEDSVRVIRITPSRPPLPAADPRAMESRARKEAKDLESENSVKIAGAGESLETLHTQIVEAIGDISGYVRYRTSQLLVVAANFDKELTKIDGQILKSLFVSMSALRTIATQMRDIENVFHYTVEALARAAEANDEDTYNHITRINRYSALVAETLGMETKFIGDISFMAQMHDVGKIQVDQALLKKPARLTGEEFEKIKLHTIYGARIIGDHPRLRMAKEIAMSHHERWDGSGYPLGISGEEIPLAARIVSIVDVYDALRSRRPYKSPKGHDTAMEIITHGDSRTTPTQFDPAVKSAFVKVNKKIDDIYRECEE